MKILTKQLGSDNILLVTSKATLAAIKTDNAKKEISERKKKKLLKEVEKLQTEIVDVCKGVLGEFNPLTARLMANLGNTYQYMGKNSEAEELLNRALELQTAMLGPDDNEVAKCHQLLAVLYDENKGQYNKAEEHFIKANKTWEKLFGPGYSQLGFNYNGLIDVYRKTGDDTKRRMFEEKKQGWEELQKETKKEKETAEKEAEETTKMDFLWIMNYVKNN